MNSAIVLFLCACVISIVAIPFPESGSEGRASRELEEAVQYGDLNKLESLINNGANVNARILDGDTLLIRASTLGHVKLVEFLLNNGADPNLQDRAKHTALHHATQSGRVKIAELLTNAGANVNLVNVWGSTPLHVAAEEGNEEIAEILLKSGANFKIKNNEGNTPWDEAEEGRCNYWLGPNKVIAVLKKYGARKRFFWRLKDFNF